MLFSAPETGASVVKDKLKTGCCGAEMKAVSEAGPGIALLNCPGDNCINRNEIYN
jgi:hypothetical protein